MSDIYSIVREQVLDKLIDRWGKYQPTADEFIHHIRLDEEEIQCLNNEIKKLIDATIIRINKESEINRKKYEV